VEVVPLILFFPTSTKRFDNLNSDFSNLFSSLCYPLGMVCVCVEEELWFSCHSPVLLLLLLHPIHLLRRRTMGELVKRRRGEGARSFHFPSPLPSLLPLPPLLLLEHHSLFCLLIFFDCSLSLFLYFNCHAILK